MSCHRVLDLVFTRFLSLFVVFSLSLALSSPITYSHLSPITPATATQSPEAPAMWSRLAALSLADSGTAEQSSIIHQHQNKTNSENILQSSLHLPTHSQTSSGPSIACKEKKERGNTVCLCLNPTTICFSCFRRLVVIELSLHLAASRRFSHGRALPPRARRRRSRPLSARSAAAQQRSAPPVGAGARGHAESTGACVGVGWIGVGWGAVGWGWVDGCR